MLEPFLFFVFAVLCVAGGLGMLISRSPIGSALWTVMTMIAIAGLYLTMNAAFIGVVQMLVYAGAIMVLFLFVIMLLNLDEMPRLGAFNWRKGAAFVLGVAVLAQLLTVVVGRTCSETGIAAAVAVVSGRPRCSSRPTARSWPSTRPGRRRRRRPDERGRRSASRC